MINKCIIAILGLTLLVALSGQAQDIDQHKLTVYGKVRTFAKADRATITISIKGEGKSLAEAFERANDRVDTVAGKLQALGLEDNALATSFFRSAENFGNKAFLSSKRDYKVTMVATITTGRLDLLEGLVTALSECDIESIDDIQFSLIDYQTIRQNALRRAVAAARAKADLICEELGIERGEAIEIEESQVTDQTPNVYRYKNNPFNATVLLDQMAGVNPGTIFPIEIQFDAEVRIVFAL